MGIEPGGRAFQGFSVGFIEMANKQCNPYTYWVKIVTL